MEVTETRTIGAHFSAVVCENRNGIEWDHAYESARSAIYALLLNFRPEHVWIPYYICDAVINAVSHAGVVIKRYKISSEFLPVDDFFIGENDLILIVNYYGLCASKIKRQLDRLPRKQVIIDCSQAFFDRDFDCLATIYSPRKFLPVPDGGGVVYDGDLPYSPSSNQDSIARYQCLLQRVADEPEVSREAYLASESSLETIGLRKMSCFTRILINSIDVDYIANRRRENFMALDFLREFNDLSFSFGESVPLCYPLMTKRAADLRQYLIQQRVLTPKYWPDVQAVGEFESKLVNETVFLPIDHRYDVDHMARISLLVKKFLGDIL